MKPAPSQRAAEPASLEDLAPSELTPTSRTQQPQQLGGVTRRIVERLDRRRSRTTGASKPKTKRKTKLTPEEQRKAAFLDPRQRALPLDNPNPVNKDNSHAKTLAPNEMVRIEAARLRPLRRLPPEDLHQL